MGKDKECTGGKDERAKNEVSGRNSSQRANPARLHQTNSVNYINQGIPPSHGGEGSTKEALRRLKNLRRDLQSNFEMLECTFTHDENTIKRAYRQIVLKHHPDKGGCAEHFKKLRAQIEKAVVAVVKLAQTYPHIVRMAEIPSD